MLADDGLQDAAVASMSAAQEPHGKGRQIDHAAGLARQTAAHRLQLVANCSTSAAVGGKSARKIVPAALHSPDSDAEFVKLSRGRI